MNKKTIIVVTGGRDYDNGQKVEEVLDGIVRMFGTDILLISGGARGLDTLALGWAYDRELNAMRVPAKWKTEGRKAGIMRNAEMLRIAIQAFMQEDVNLVMVAFPGGLGTADMVDRMLKLEDALTKQAKNGSRCEFMGVAS